MAAKCHILVWLLLIICTIPIKAQRQAYECISISRPQTRTFDSLVDFQSNKLSFKPGGLGFAGNLVDFRFISIDVIPRNSFNTFDSQYILKISLNDKKIQQIQDGAFLFLTCLHLLDLQNNSLVHLSPDIFKGLVNLVTLKLNGNILTELRNLVFTHLFNLRDLDLSKNRIRQIDVEAFDGLHHLKALNLASNLLVQIHDEVLTSLRNLLVLQLNSNKLAHLHPENWRDLTNLTTLNLADNSLQSFDTSYNFSFSALTHLNVSMNSLTVLNVYLLRKNLPKLSTIDINGNPWKCEDVESIVRILNDARIFYVKTQKAVTNVDGVPCLLDNSTSYTTSRNDVDTTSTTKITSTTGKSHEGFVDNSLNVSREIKDAMKMSSAEVLGALKSTQNVLIFLVLVVLIFITLDLMLRSGIMNRIISRREQYLIDNRNVENIALLQP